jgi:hypothetical protein
MDKVADTVGLNPIELRILNAYRDGDMKAHRRLAKNCALIECCQVVAEKADVKLSPAMLAASSRKDGGGERARLPISTATDEHGLVRGFQGGSYGRKGAKPAPLTGISQTMPSATPAASQTPPPAAAPQQPPARAGSMRFSSISGFRRR